jgi:hypothetical protein
MLLYQGQEYRAGSDTPAHLPLPLHTNRRQHLESPNSTHHNNTRRQYLESPTSTSNPIQSSGRQHLESPPLLILHNRLSFIYSTFRKSRGNAPQQQPTGQATIPRQRPPYENDFYRCPRRAAINTYYCRLHSALAERTSTSVLMQEEEDGGSAEPTLSLQSRREWWQAGQV